MRWGALVLLVLATGCMDALDGRPVYMGVRAEQHLEGTWSDEVARAGLERIGYAGANVTEDGATAGDPGGRYLLLTNASESIVFEISYRQAAKERSGTDEAQRRGERECGERGPEIERLVSGLAAATGWARKGPWTCAWIQPPPNI